MQSNFLWAFTLPTVNSGFLRIDIKIIILLLLLSKDSQLYTVPTVFSQETKATEDCIDYSSIYRTGK